MTPARRAKIDAIEARMGELTYVSLVNWVIATYKQAPRTAKADIQIAQERFLAARDGGFKLRRQKMVDELERRMADQKITNKDYAILSKRLSNIEGHDAPKQTNLNVQASVDGLREQAKEYLATPGQLTQMLASTEEEPENGS